MFDDSQLQKAYEFAVLAHTGQLRKSGEPFINHPVAVAKTLLTWKLDKTAVMAGLLHDTIEDGGATSQDLTKEFGPEVATIVDGVTKIAKVHLKGSTKDSFVENLRKMILVMAHDLRVILVKLADRLHNMQTLEYLLPERQLEIAKETLEIYAPLAERLGMGQVKTQLEDLAFKYVYSQEYERLAERTGKMYTEGDMYVKNFHKELLKLLVHKKVRAEVNIRHKGLYSLFKKSKRPEIDNDLNKVYDLVASRVLVDTVEQCYLVLGAVHNKWTPVPYLGMRDYIATPKPNGYRSIHTNIFGPEGRIVEVQIRTQQMHEEAEWGVSAHWQYAQAKAAGVSDEKLEKGEIKVSEKLNWVRQLVAWQKEISDSQEYLNALKFDALQHRNFVFSPKGDVFDLPWGATPVDFAYAVHTKLGNQAIGAKVNGKMVGLNHKLRNGDVVEILVDRKRHKPNPDWLDFAVTTEARHEINKIIKS